MEEGKVVVPKPSTSALLWLHFGFQPNDQREPSNVEKTSPSSSGKQNVVYRWTDSRRGVRGDWKLFWKKKKKKTSANFSHLNACDLCSVVQTIENQQHKNVLNVEVNDCVKHT